jgi:uncharacterized protein (TIGR02266 family)
MAESRRDLHVPVQIQLRRSNGRTSTEYAVNLSPGGACLHVKDPMESGEQIQLSFTIPSETAPVSVAAKVIWCTCEEERGDQFCELGVQFQGLDDGLRKRLTRFAEQAGDPRR